MNTLIQLKQESTLDDLISKAAYLDNEIKMKKKELEKLKKKIYEDAIFEDGKKTTYLIGGGYKVKIQKRENFKIDQEKIKKVKQAFPQVFSAYFKEEYKIIDKKLLSRISDENFKKAINWAVEVKEGTPSFEFQILEEDTLLED